MADELAALHRLPVGVVRVDLRGTVLAANQCLAAWMGAAPGDLQGQHVDRLFTRGGRVLYHTHLLPMLRMHGQVQEFSLVLDAPSGPVHALTCATLEEEAGLPTALLVLSPMRERQRVEAELLRVQRAADAAPAALFEYAWRPATAGRFVYASAAMASLYGLSPEAVHTADDALWQCVHPDDLADVMARREASARTGGQWAAQYRARPGGQLAWAWHALAARAVPQADGGTVWHGTITDITHQVEMERAAQSRDAADRASRAKSEFLARMSHELRTPLNGILGFARLMAVETGPGLDPEVRRRLGIIEALGHQLRGLIDEVMDITRIEAGALHLDAEPLLLLPHLQRCLADMEPMAAGARANLALHCSADLAVLADARRFEQVMANLLSNALKYGRRNGRVVVRATERAGQVAVEVSDTGVGLSAEQLEHLFEPFNRLGAERSIAEGSGLGLVITRGLVEAMGGRLEVESRLGEGSTFRVLLPCSALAPAPDQSGARRLQPVRLQGPPRRVLYVEDNEINAMLMRELLRDVAGLELVVETSGRDALQWLRAETPDLLLLDMHLPDMGGCELLAQLRRLPTCQGVPAIAVSADAMPDDIARARAAGFSAYWTKPVDIDAVRADIVALLMGRTA